MEYGIVSAFLSRGLMSLRAGNAAAGILESRALIRLLRRIFLYYSN